MLNRLDLEKARGKTVLVRCNFDVPVENDKVLKTFAWRINVSVSFLRELAGVGVRTIIISHRGRPQGQDDDLSLRPVFEYLQKEFGDKILFGSGEVKDGELVLRENIRFDDREEANDDSLAQELASGSDFYVNNDFATAHRAHASTAGVTRHLPSYAGPLLSKEVEALEAVVRAKERPLVLVIGGAKSDTKLKIISDFLEKAETILVGGVLANTILKKKGIEVGISVVGDNEVSGAIVSSDRIVLPKDTVVSTSLEQAENVAIRKIGEVKPSEAILDIGPETREIFAEKIAGAAQIVWNGPLGLFEIPEFRAGSQEFAKSFVASSAKTLAGGGDTVTFLNEEGMLEKIDHVSTGGGAMLAFLAGERLPALGALGYYDGS